MLHETRELNACVMRSSAICNSGCLIVIRLVGAFSLWWGVLCGPVSAESTNREPVLHLANAGFLRGHLMDSDEHDVIRWRSDLFSQSLRFPLSGVSTVRFPDVAPRPDPSGAYCIEFAESDVVYGDIMALSDESLTLKSSHAGTIHIQRASVHRIYRWKETSLIYLGPNGLDGWSVGEPGTQTEELWTNDGGWPRTAKANASLYRDFGLPARCSIEFELAWEDMPDFEFVMGTKNLRDEVGAIGPPVDTRTLEDAFRFEVWDGELVIMGESERDADVASVTPIARGPGAVRIQLYLDQEKQRLSIYSRQGSHVATVRLHSRHPEVRSGLRLTHRKGNIQLKHLRLAHWDGILPHNVESNRSRIHQIDGTIVYGQVTGFDAATEKFTLVTDESTFQIDAANVSDVFLSPVTQVDESARRAAADSKMDSDDARATTEHGAGHLRVTCQTGATFSGEYQGVQNGQVVLNSESIDESLRLSISDLRSISQRNSVAAVEPQPASGPGGRLELEGAKLKGRLIDGRETAQASCLVWHPDLSLTASPLARGISGRIVYREPVRVDTAPEDSVQNRQRQPQQANQKPAIQGFGDVFKKMLTGKIATARKPEFRTSQTLHLRSGDTIPCEVLSVDEDGLHFTTPLSSATFVENERVKGLELDGRLGAPSLEETKRRRLLTLPRVQKNSPPTHLICSTNGDFLRGRLIAMNDETLTVEVRLTNQEIPRNRVAQIIWLHADELESAGRGSTSNSIVAEQNAEGARSAEKQISENNNIEPTRVQAVARHKDRLTFLASSVQDAVISGRSDILGDCRSELAEIDQLLIGDYIEQAAAQLAYQRWKLRYAVEPEFVLAGQTDAEGRISDGTQSPLVGKPAPDFRLKNLSGSQFQLADHRGDVIVLDFWATWCSPCLKTMPLVDEVVTDFSDHDVRLLAVNMEEQPVEIRSTLERHQLDVPVILDIDGVAAARYAVTSIPQTVVIDREGRIARVFVGGGPELVEPLRQALQELVGDAADGDGNRDPVAQ